MSPERWRQLEGIFQSAADCPPRERAAFLDSASAGDPELRREVESLLALHDKSGPTIPSALPDALAVLEQRSAQQNEGRRIGAYRIIREIGHGGMGNVYLAARSDDAFEKLVALKVIRRGLDTDEITGRFRAERQILAMLDHPNVARLLDGGTTDDGLPYFVMEYIEGEPIDQYCETHKVTVAERLRLFQGVCAAVSYAHQNLIVHRDIKPGNVLVTKEGVPRLLDFGIAKLLAPQTAAHDMTVTALRPLTPEYASPEQVRGDPVATASDIYSLGVLLYGLLAGHRPYRSAMTSPAAIENAICHEEPEKPSDRGPKELRRQLRGDLDTIVLMALRKEPRRRYPSVEQFSGDIRRHLARLPVIARPDTLGYRAAKFVQRNKAWVAMAAITFLSLAGGIAASLWQTHVARLEQAKAARINAFLQEMVGYSDTDPSSANRKKGHDATVADMLDDAAQRVETELAGQPEVKAEMLATIGGTYLVQSKYDSAARFLHEAYDLNVRLYGSESKSTAAVMHGLGGLSYLTGDYTAAASWFQKAVPIYRTHTRDADFEVRLMVAMLSDAAFADRAVGRFDQAEALWREALSYAPRLPPKYRAQTITPKTFLAQLYIDRGDLEKADPLASEASRELRALGTDHFPLAQSLIDLGNIRRLEARYAEADSLIQEGTGLYAQVQGEDHPNVAFGLLSLATSRYYQGRYDLAQEDLGKAQKIIAAKIPKGANSYAAAQELQGRILCKTGRPREAEPVLRDALATRRQRSHRPLDVALAAGSLGECLLAQKRYAEAEPLLVASYQTLQSLQVPRSPALKEARGRLETLYATRGKASGSPLYVP